MGRVLRVYTAVAIIMAFFLTAACAVALGDVATLDAICKDKNLSAEQCAMFKQEVSRKELQTPADHRPFMRPAKSVPPKGAAKPGQKHAPAGPAAEGAPAVREGASLFNRYIVDKPIEDPAGLMPFGYNIFLNASGRNLSFNMPAADDYIVGPGDEVVVYLWGRLNGRHNLTVDRNGGILIPEIGPFTVAGMRFKQMEGFLKKQVKNIIGTDINVTMGKLRSIQVFVLGEVRNPGPYNLTAMSTITDGVIASGGPSAIGSLRNVRLKRAGKDVAEMDFYDLFLRGDKSADLRLRDGDVIFVPTVGPLVGVTGNVRRPAVYELKGPTALASLLDIAGGVIPTAYTQQIQVERVKDNLKRIVVDVNAEAGGIEGFTLQDADLVKVFSIFDRDMNAVYLKGNVKRPGKYELKAGMRLSDVITGPDDLLEETYFDYGLIKRPVRETGEITLLPFNLGGLFKGSEQDDIELRPKDTIHVFSRWMFQDRPKVSIEGEVRNKGEFPYEKDLTVKDLVLDAGGLTKDASLGNAELYRTDQETMGISLITFNLGRAMDGVPEDNLLLRGMDRVVVHSILETDPMRTLTVSGEVNRPGKLQYASNMRLRDLVFASGNVKESAYLDEAELATHEIKDGKLSAIKMKKVNLRKALAGDPSENILLNPYDSLFVKKIPDWLDEKFVKLNGEFRFPGRYLVKKGERLSSVIERAGGFTNRAYLKGAVLSRESVKSMQQKNLDEAIERLEKTMFSQTLSDVQTAASAESAKQLLAVAEQRKALLAKMRSAKAKGRMVVKLAPPEELKGSPYDILLEGDDTLFVPERPSVVSVAGSVVNPTSFIYDPGEGISGYIKKSGGANEFADLGKVYVIKVDGSALSAENLKRWKLIDWNEQTRSWDFGSVYSSLDPGDTIVVPEKTDRVAWLMQIKDLTQILYQIAVTAGVIIVAF